MYIPKEEVKLIRQLLRKAFEALNHKDIDAEIMSDELHESKVIESRKYDFQSVPVIAIDTLGLTSLCGEMSNYLEDLLEADEEQEKIMDVEKLIEEGLKIAKAPEGFNEDSYKEGLKKGALFMNAILSVGKRVVGRP